MPVGATLAATTAASVGGAVIQSNAASDAADAAQSAADKNNALASKIYGDATGNLQPFVDNGKAAGNALNGLLGLSNDAGASDAAFKKYLGSTNYQFQLGQGMDAIKYAGAPSFNSGATAKALNNYAQGQAGSALAGYQGQLAGQQGSGIQAGGALANTGTNYVGQTSSNNNNAATAAGNAAIYAGNAQANALGNLSKAFGAYSGQSSFGGGAGGINPAGNMGDPTGIAASIRNGGY